MGNKSSTTSDDSEKNGGISISDGQDCKECDDMSAASIAPDSPEYVLSFFDRPKKSRHIRNIHRPETVSSDHTQDTDDDDLDDHADVDTDGESCTSRGYIDSPKKENCRPSGDRPKDVNILDLGANLDSSDESRKEDDDEEEEDTGYDDITASNTQEEEDDDLVVDDSSPAIIHAHIEEVEDTNDNKTDADDLFNAEIPTTAEEVNSVDGFDVDQEDEDTGDGHDAKGNIGITRTRRAQDPNQPDKDQGNKNGSDDDNDEVDEDSDSDSDTDVPKELDMSNIPKAIRWYNGAGLRDKEIIQPTRLRNRRSKNHQPEPSRPEGSNRSSVEGESTRSSSAHNSRSGRTMGTLSLDLESTATSALEAHGQNDEARKNVAARMAQRRRRRMGNNDVGKITSKRPRPLSKGNTDLDVFNFPEEEKEKTTRETAAKVKANTSPRRRPVSTLTGSTFTHRRPRKKPKARASSDTKVLEGISGVKNNQRPMTLVDTRDNMTHANKTPPSHQVSAMDSDSDRSNVTIDKNHQKHPPHMKEGCERNKICNSFDFTAGERCRKECEANSVFCADHACDCPDIITSPAAYFNINLNRAITATVDEENPVVVPQKPPDGTNVVTSRATHFNINRNSAITTTVAEGNPVVVPQKPPPGMSLAAFKFASTYTRAREEFDTDESDSEDESESDESDEEDDDAELEKIRAAADRQSKVNGVYTAHVYNRMFRRCESNLGDDLDDIEDGNSIRAANSRVKNSDSKWQNKAQYGRLLPKANEKIMSILGVTKDDIFLDIGHGVGNTCKFCHKWSAQSCATKLHLSM